MIRMDALWLCPLHQDMRSDAERLLNVVVNSLGQAQAHHGYSFANARATRIKLLAHDGFGVWCAARRLRVGRFAWLDRETAAAASAALRLSPQQFDALALGLPWQRLGELSSISRC